MFARVLVVATAVGGLPQVITHGDTGLLVYDFQPLELAEAIMFCADNPAERDSMAERAYAYVSANHSADAWSQRYLDLFRGLTAKQ